jgi:ADP-ribose pyrophosphatase YjhB (NUDIX family)
MKFCSQCGAAVELKIPEGDDRPRHVCVSCHTIHYSNPKVVTGCIPEWGDQLLLCRRAIKPRHGYWTLPAGFMENGESVQEGAARETWEEAQAKVQVTDLYTTFNLPHIDQVYMLFRGRLLAPEFGPGPESLEVKLFNEDEIPWDELAFPVVAETLRIYFADRKRGEFGHHLGDIRRQGDSRWRYSVTMLTESTEAE